MVRNGIIAVLVSGCAVTLGHAQANILNAKTPQEIGVRTDDQIQADDDHPLEYGYVDDRDILWSKTVWEIIDLDERINFPYYYPTDTVGISSNRRSLFDVLMNNIQNGNIKEIYADSYFSEKRTLQELEASMKKVDTLDKGIQQLNAGLPISPEYIDIVETTAVDIEQYWIRGIWYFDKRQGELKYRLLGIAPVATDVNFRNSEDPELLDLFWVWFPDTRQVLHDAKVLNNQNDAIPSSYDHLLNSRRFSATIFKEGNVYEDRQIKDYIRDNALMQLLESQRIKEQILNFEQDMWSY